MSSGVAPELSYPLYSEFRVRKSLRKEVFGATPETTTQRRILPGTSDKMTMHSQRLDELPFQNAWNFVPCCCPGQQGSGLAAVARPNRDNVWNETGILRTFPNKGLKFRWRTPVGRLDKPSRGPRPGLPDRYEVG